MVLSQSAYVHVILYCHLEGMLTGNAYYAKLVCVHLYNAKYQFALQYKYSQKGSKYNKVKPYRRDKK